MKIKAITNVSTVGELKKYLRGMPDDIVVRTMDGESSYSEPLGILYIEHLRELMVRTKYDMSSRWVEANQREVEVAK